MYSIMHFRLSYLIKDVDLSKKRLILFTLEAYMLLNLQFNNSTGYESGQRTT